MEDAKHGIIEEIHKPARRTFARRRVYTKGLLDLWQIDLVDLQKYSKFNNGYKYILNVIDVFSKYAWSEPLRNKQGVSVTEAMRKILDNENPRVPTNIQCDAGKEFYNKSFRKLMSDYNINMYSTYSIMKSSVVERFNQSLLSLLYKRFHVNGNYKWLTVLPEIVKFYNNRHHRSINMAPARVTKKDEKRLLKILNKLPTVRKPLKFKINDVVRISKHRTVFSKSYNPRWTTELFTIFKIRKTVPPMFYVKDSLGRPILGGLYTEEISKTKYPDTYLVEKVIRKDSKGTYVKFLGLGKEYNSYIQT